jgi:hypothetical protein
VELDTAAFRYLEWGLQLQGSQLAEPPLKLLHKQIGLFKRGEVAAAIQPIPINQTGIAILGPVAYHFWPAWAALIGVD